MWDVKVDGDVLGLLFLGNVKMEGRLELFGNWKV